MDGRDRIIDELRALVAKQAAQIEQLTARIAELELALAKAKKDSSTSSKPPSSDIVTPKPKQKKPGRRKKRKRGGQPGHQQQLREPLPPERVDETIDYEIDDGEVRRLGLTPTGDFDVIQHIELPDTPIHVTEYRLAVYQDADGNIYIPDCPELKGPIFGPRLLRENEVCLLFCSLGKLRLSIDRDLIRRRCGGVLTGVLHVLIQDVSPPVLLKRDFRMGRHGGYCCGSP